MTKCGCALFIDFVPHSGRAFCCSVCHPQSYNSLGFSVIVIFHFVLTFVFQFFIQIVFSDFYSRFLLVCIFSKMFCFSLFCISLYIVFFPFKYGLFSGTRLRKKRSSIINKIP